MIEIIDKYKVTCV